MKYCQHLYETMTSRFWLGVVLLSLVSLSLTSCTTFGRKDKGSDDDFAMAAASAPEEATPAEDAPRDVVVIRSGLENAEVSAHERSYWLTMRSSSKASVKRMYAALATGEHVAAGDMARSYLRKRPGDLDALTILAVSLALQKKYALAAYYGRAIDRQSPDSAVSLNLRGLAAMLTSKARMADYHRATKHFQQAFDSSSSEIASGLNLGHLYLELGNANAAINTFDEASRRCGNCQAALMGSGIAASRLGKYDAAKSAFAKVLDKNKNDTRALYHMALVQKNGFKDKGEATRYLERLIETRSKDVYLTERAHSVLRMIKGERDAPVAPPSNFDDSDGVEALAKDLDDDEDTGDALDVQTGPESDFMTTGHEVEK